MLFTSHCIDSIYFHYPRLIISDWFEKNYTHGNVIFSNVFELIKTHFFLFNRSNVVLVIIYRVTMKTIRKHVLREPTLLFLSADKNGVIEVATK